MYNIVFKNDRTQTLGSFHANGPEHFMGALTLVMESITKFADIKIQFDYRNRNKVLAQEALLTIAKGTAMLTPEQVVNNLIKKVSFKSEPNGNLEFCTLIFPVHLIRLEEGFSCMKLMNKIAKGFPDKKFVMSCYEDLEKERLKININLKPEDRREVIRKVWEILFAYGKVEEPVNKRIVDEVYDLSFHGKIRQSKLNKHNTLRKPEELKSNLEKFNKRFKGFGLKTKH